MATHGKRERSRYPGGSDKKQKLSEDTPTTMAPARQFETFRGKVRRSLERPSRLTGRKRNVLDNTRLDWCCQSQRQSAGPGALLFTDTVVRDGRINKGKGRGERSSGNTATRLTFQREGTRSVNRPRKGPCGRTQDAKESQKGRTGCRTECGLWPVWL